MPLAPVKPVNNNETSRAYKEAGRRLDQLAQSGMSWSGNERNCAFLNLGDGRFANLSAVTGFDFTDDGRALALVDWDLDGDLDVWAANRTGPRLRFLRNDTAAGHHFVAVRLVGRRTNRDAIGARVEVRCDRGTQPLIKTLRAGEGFLGQSSKWLHFGLGDQQQIERLVVRWPGGKDQTFTNLRADRWYRIVEDDPQIQEWSPPSRNIQLASSQTQPPPQPDSMRITLRSRVPLPRWEYDTFEGETISHSSTAPLLLVLWASSCRPCVEELRDLTLWQPKLRELGLSVMALSVDRLSESGTTDDVRPLLRSLEFPYDAGLATEDIVDKLQLVHNHLFKPHRPLSVPASFLIDSTGHLVVIYKGRLRIDDLVDDVSTLSLKPEQLLQRSLPFAGRWIGAPRAGQLLPLPASLIDHGFVDDAIRYVQDNWTELARDPGFAELLLRLGRAKLEQGHSDDAIAWFQRASKINPRNADAYYNLGIAFASGGQMDEAIEHYEQALAIKPTHVKAINNLGNVHLSQRAFDKAEQVYRRALRIDDELADVHYNLANVYQARKEWNQARQHYHRAVQIDPGHAQAHNNLGILLAAQGEMDLAADHYRQAVTSDPAYAQAHNNLGTAMALAGDVQAAIAHYRQAVRLQPELADAHRNLGRTLLSRDQHAEALTHLRAAAGLKPSDTESLMIVAWLLGAHPDPKVRNPEEAIRLAKRAAELTHRRNASVLDVLAAAHAATGDFENAVRTVDEAIQIFDQQNRDAEVTELRRRRELYRNRKPLRITLP